MRAWWWRSVAACGSLAAVAGTVAAVAAALDADRTDRLAALDSEQVTARPVTARPETARPETARPETARPDAGQLGPVPSRPAEPRTPTPASGPAPSRPAEARPAEVRVGAPGLGASVTVPAGWRRVPGQRLIPVPAGRFPLVLAPNDRAAVLVGTLDPARVGTPADPVRLGAEARRLVGAFADGTDPDARPAGLTDAADTVDGRRAWTSRRRTDGGPRDLAGTLVRVTAVEGAPRGVVAVAVVRPGPGQAADARAADAIVGSLDLGGDGPGGRPVSPRRATPPPATPPPRPGRP